MSENKKLAKKKSKNNTKKVDLHSKIQTNIEAIDDIFSSIKKKRSDDEERIQEINSKKKKSKKDHNQLTSNDDEPKSKLSYGIIQSCIYKPKIISPEAPLERIDKESGLPVYKVRFM
jgi:hypothetical protein